MLKVAPLDWNFSKDIQKSYDVRSDVSFARCVYYSCDGRYWFSLVLFSDKFVTPVCVLNSLIFVSPRTRSLECRALIKRLGFVEV